MRAFPRLLGALLLALLTGLLLLGTSACETSRTRTERADPTRNSTGISDAAAALSGSASSREIMQLDSLGKPQYQLAPSVIQAALIRQFKDGTVIDKVLVRQALLDDPKDKGKGPYYLVGMGQRNGQFRAIAMPLRAGGDGSYFLTPNADRYVLTGSRCPRCFFDFENGSIVGTSCDDSPGGTCDLQVLPANEVFIHQ